MGISLDYNPKDFKFSEYEGLIQGKICHREVGFRQTLRSFSVCFGFRDFSLIINLISSIYAFCCNFFYINDKTYIFNTIKYQNRYLEIIKEKYDKLNFQTHFFNHVILLIIKIISSYLGTEIRYIYNWSLRCPLAEIPHSSSTIFLCCNSN